MSKRIAEGVDRLSTLPEPLLHHIMSHFSFEQVVYYSVLCKKWMQAAHSLPSIKYNEMHYEMGKREKILEFLERLLLKRHVELTNITEFGMRLQIWQDRVALVDRCLSYVIASNVKELRLEGLCYWDDRSWRYNVPQFVLSAKTIEVLELTGFKLELRRIDLKLPSLKRLCLMRVFADERVLENLIAGSPLIEYLKVDICDGFRRLELSNLNKLRKIKVFSHVYNCDLKQVDINALHVDSVTISLPFAQFEINAANCKSLRRLKLCMVSIVDEWLCREISKLPVLEYLSIMDCHRLERVKISSPSLKHLIIGGLNLVEVKIDTPNLSRFEYMGDIIPFSLNDLALAESDLHFYSENCDLQWFVKYTELLAKFHQISKALFLHSNGGENVIIPAELRRIQRPPCPVIKHIDFTITDEDKGFPISQLVDGLLWICPHAMSITIQYEFGLFDKFCFLFSYKKRFIYDEETRCCSHSLPVSCWKHCIKEVDIDHIIQSLGKVQIVETYNFEDEILEKIAGISRYEPEL
ncbi:putative F-box/LRR-repeat protein At3g18150 [Pistacia vera]|uniref:putative F-box/LRR-repeat protein At3g18150 n=1 Tax=Pistacia vera TaxID=55513 RepID=UPI0012631265|nr:putative F-box/LRR-repeat protein At3g18150 [Pistacia vera]